MGNRYLPIYLQDHLAGAIGALELLKRSLASNRGNEFGAFLRGLLVEIEEDRRALEAAMRRLGVRSSTAKNSALWVAEKVGRLKLNGRLAAYSPLSRLEELEALKAGVEAKASMWRVLATLRDRLPEIRGLDLESLVRRAEDQASRIGEQLLRAADELAPSSP